MLYYKVKPQYDNYRKNDGDIYIADELYTEKEIVKQKLNKNYLEAVQISKKQIYFFFGARFADK